MMEQEDIFNEEPKKTIFVDYTNSDNNGNNPSNKKKKRIIIAVTIVLVAMIIGASFVAGYFTAKSNGIEGDMPLMIESYELLKKYYYEDISWADFQVIASKAMMDSVDAFTSMQDIDNSTGDISLGISIKTSTYNEHKISYIVPGSPANQAVSSIKYNDSTLKNPETLDTPVKLEIGDKIYAVSVNNLAPTVVESASRTLLLSLVSASDNVTLYVVKSNGKDEYLDEYYEFDITKQFVEAKQAHYYDSAAIGDTTNTTAMIKLDSFTKSAVKDFSECLDQYIEGGCSNLILDLRGNGGGDSEILGYISGCLIDGAATSKQNIAYYKYNAGNGNFKDRYFTSNLSYTYNDSLTGESVEYKIKNLPSLVNNFKMTILTDGGSASCSEVLIGALQYYNNVEIIGSTTYGKGVAQTVRQLSDGEHYLLITNGKYYIPTRSEDGSTNWTTSIHGVGFVPTSVNRISNNSVRPYKYDLYIARALELLGE